jgi:hypothetical protein
MTALTISGKGQATLRKELLRHLGVRPGDKIEVNMLPNGRIEARAARRTRHISDIFGALKRPGQPTLSIEEINRIIEEGWGGKR